MKYKYYELQGAFYQPQEAIIFLDGYIIPSSKHNSISLSEAKLVYLFEDGTVNLQDKILIFVYCYQYLFLQSDVYFYYAQSPYKLQEIEANNIGELKEHFKTGQFSVINFDEIDPFPTSMDTKINFFEFHEKFSNQYQQNKTFKNIVDLFLYTVGEKHNLYNNVLQKIAQLQTIFETLLGDRPKNKAICGLEHFKPWKDFIEKRLQELGISDKQYIELFVKIHKLFNYDARINYIHYSKHLNLWQKTIEEIKNKSAHYYGMTSYSTDVDAILNDNLKIDQWSALDWENMYRVYQFIIRKLINIKYLQ